ncbi:hypothetical protein [Methanobacterium petrolearium]|uniref:hypothetical protein n=1 Tax=Methanobacterium petrolearium TaxID=710190 RepID=UPI001AE85D85|nr:hypothetical protein [Methanobacterium petrolearium]MBP1945437.1 hypothetical protein [Methanobacterium petrolearium]BDZ71635.1 hypothetical protein GCM10025861_21520 [Methanobacterium petrolearium]
MVSRRSKLLIFVVAAVLLVLILVGYLYVCSSNPTDVNPVKPGYGMVNDSQFQIESGWYQDFSTGYGSSAKLKFNGSTDEGVVMIMVDQYPDQAYYKKAYDDLSQKPEWHVSSSGTSSREGLSVKTIQVSRDAGGETVQYYFFQKNGKYYQILIDMISSDASTFFANERYKLDQTVNTIIRTIN